MSRIYAAMFYADKCFKLLQLLTTNIKAIAVIIDRQQYPNNSQFTPATTADLLIPQQNQNIPLLAHLGTTTVDTENYFQQYQNLLAGFKGNLCLILYFKHSTNQLLC